MAFAKVSGRITNPQGIIAKVLASLNQRTSVTFKTQLRSDDDEEDRAEPAEQDRQMAEARWINNKYYSNPTEKDSDSELSVLASSQFNGTVW